MQVMKTSSESRFSRSGLLLALVIISFFSWASYFEIDHSVRLSGQVIPRSRTQVVQAADGGVLKELLVIEGQAVKKGQVIARLENDRAEAGVQDTTERIASLEVALDRANAEALGREADFSRHAAKLSYAVKSQRDLHEKNRVALNAEMSALSAQLALAEKELLITSSLYEQGYASLVEKIRAERASLEVQQKLQMVQKKFSLDARREAVKIEEELTSLGNKEQERQSVYQHTEIRAPADGLVKLIRFNTVGGVLRPGDELLQIYPTEGGLIVEAKAGSPDIGSINVGQTARLRFDSFDSSVVGAMTGQVTYVSADALSEQSPDGRTQSSYRIHVDLDEAQGKQNLLAKKIKPGMAVTVDLVSGRRTISTYLLKPVMKAFGAAMTER